MLPRLTDRDSEDGMRFRPFAVPLIIFAIAGSVAAAMALSGSVGAGLGLAVGAAAATALLVFAARAKPGRRVEVAEGDARHRVLVLATAEATPEATERIAKIAENADDVRLVVPLPSRRLDRWLSAEDPARAEAERRLAHSAGALTAAGLPVSGSLGDSDPAQALEDELRGYAADEVVLLAGAEEPGGANPLAGVESRLKLPLRRVSSG
jgi:hypothetical protein